MMVAGGGLTFYDDERDCIHYGAMLEVGWASSMNDECRSGWGAHEDKLPKVGLLTCMDPKPLTYVVLDRGATGHLGHSTVGV